MDLSQRLRIVASVDDADTPSDVIDLLGLAAFVSGDEPYSNSVRIHRVRAEATLLPAGVVPVRSWRDPDGASVLAIGEDWTLRARRWGDRSADLTVTAARDELGRRILAEATEGAAEPAPARDGMVTMGFWHGGDRAGRRTERAIKSAPWSAISSNYARTVAPSLERLVGVDPAHLPGRLILLHGPPGTGKTSLLRTLAHAWRSWCRVDYVLDPEQLLARPDYLMRVALDGDRDEGDSDEGDSDDGDRDDGEGAEPVGTVEGEARRPRRRWRMLVLEDCDELIRVEAKQGAGQGLARLLNLTDGLLGQGLDVLVCITTNEDLARLHPAVVRPGRCLAQIHVGRLPRAEASAWLGSSVGIGSEGASLAELFARRDRSARIDAQKLDEPVGLYL